VALAARLVIVRPPRPRTMRFTVSAPQGTLNARWPRVSPDGRQLAFLASDSTGTRIWIRPLDAFDAYPLSGAESPGRPFWSPDGKSLGYFAGGKLRRIAVAGGPSIPIAETPGSDGSWGKDFILFDGSAADSIRMIPASGGAVKPASRIDRAAGETGAAWPCFLPDGRHFLYLAITLGGSGNIRIGEVGSLQSRSLGRTDGRIEFAPPGYLIFPLEGTLMAQRFDMGRLVTVGEPVPVGERLTLGTTSGEFSVSRTGMLVYRAGSEGKSQLLWLDRTGKVIDASCPPGAYSNLSLEPDGKRAAVDILVASTRSDLWLRDFPRGVLSRLTFSGTAFWPTCAPDGDRIAYTSNVLGAEYRVYIMSLSARDHLDSLAHLAGTQEGPTSWSRDGHWLLVDRLTGTKSWDVIAYPMGGGGAPVTVAATTFAEREARFSPDGKWVAYASNESGRNEIYVQSFPAATSRAQVSTDGGLQPGWRGDGRELYYVAPDQSVMAVPVQLTPSLEAGNPVKLFTVPLVNDGNVQCRYAAADDGQRFLCNVADRTSQAEEFSVIDAWTADLKGR
jgi:Tol biopolymer transport system component